MGIKKIEYDWARTATDLEGIASRRVDGDARWRLVAILPMTIAHGTTGVSGNVEGYAAWFEWEDCP